MTEEDEVAVAQYGRLKKVADSVRGGGMSVFRSVHVGASVNAVVVLKVGLWRCLRFSRWWFVVAVVYEGGDLWG